MDLKDVWRGLGVTELFSSSADLTAMSGKRLLPGLSRKVRKYLAVAAAGTGQKSVRACVFDGRFLTWGSSLGVSELGLNRKAPCSAVQEADPLQAIDGCSAVMPDGIRTRGFIFYLQRLFVHSTKSIKLLYN